MNTEKGDELVIQLLQQLSEDFRESRNETQQLLLELTQRITTVETQVKTVVGNGQPGLISKLEVKVAEHKAECDKREKFRIKDRYLVIGGSSVVGAVITALAFIVKEFLVK